MLRIQTGLSMSVQVKSVSVEESDGRGDFLLFWIGRLNMLERGRLTVVDFEFNHVTQCTFLDELL
jgi:hypothetical protein